MVNHLVIGAGITGLNLAWHIKCLYPNDSIVVLEKSSRVGGWIQTIDHEGFLFELGPHSARGADIFALAQKLGLSDQIIYSNSAAKRRYIYHQGKLQALPTSFLELVCARWMYPAFWGLLSEPFRKKGHLHDESVQEMMYRRIGKRATDLLVDPLVKGIYGGSMETLSSAWAFPKLYEWEKQYGSFLMGALRSKKKEKKMIFSFKNGMQTLIDALYGKLKENIFFNKNVKKVESHQVMCTCGREFTADKIYDTRPKQCELPYLGLHVVSLGYNHAELVQEGFGYLIPTSEKEDVLGVIWDSSIFPEQNRGKQARLTVMVKEGIQNPIEIALEAVGRQMELYQKPDAVHHFHAQKAIVQYPVGYQIKPSLVCELGTHVSGVSLNDCIAYARKISYYR